MERTRKAWLILGLFLVAFLVASEGRDAPVQGEVYHPEFFFWSWLWPWLAGLPKPGEAGITGLNGYSTEAGGKP